MSTSVKCPNRDCDQMLTLTPDLAGKKGKCPKCGKTFQIPKSLGSGGRSAQKPQKAAGAPSGKTATSAEKTAAEAGKVSKEELAAYLVDDDEDDLFSEEPAVAEVVADEKPRRRAPAADEIEDYDAEAVAEAVVEATVVEDDLEPARPRRRRRRRDDYDDGYADDETEAFEDEDDDFVPRTQYGKPGMSKTRRWALGSIGFLILAISTCVVGGAFALSMISEAFAQISSASGKMSLFNAAIVFAKIGQIVWIMGVIGTITGYVFCIFIPNQRASLGLTIAALSVCVVNMILGIIFQMVPIFREFGWVGYADLVGSRSILAGWLGGIATAGHEILSMFMEFGRYAEFMLLALFMAAIAKAQKDRQHASDCMRIVWLMTGMAGAILVMYVFMFIDVSPGDRWPIYIVRILNWGANALLTITFVFLIMNLFYSRTSTK